MADLTNNTKEFDLLNPDWGRIKPTKKENLEDVLIVTKEIIEIVRLYSNEHIDKTSFVNLITEKQRLLDIALHIVK